MTDPKRKQQWDVEQHIKNWVELPIDVRVNSVLCRVGVTDVLSNRCKFYNMFSTRSLPEMVNMFKHVVDHSEGELNDITISHFANDELIEYVADRSCKLRRLRIVCGYPGVLDGLKHALKKLPLSEELNLYKIRNSREALETAVRYCPMLTTLRVNQEAFRFWPWENSRSLNTRDNTATAIGENLPELTHLELIGNNISNVGLKAILDGCPHLEVLDLRRCFYIDLNGDLGKKCLKKIKCVKLPNDSLEGCLYYQEY